MPKFRVPITRDCTETTYWIAEADTVEEAVSQALDKVRQFGQTGMMLWERDDCTNLERHVYFAGDNDLEEIDEPANTHAIARNLDCALRRALGEGELTDDNDPAVIEAIAIEHVRTSDA
jgi:hypothetical protein